jgi:glucose-6-phosphate 1-dehydrogenase
MSRPEAYTAHALVFSGATGEMDACERVPVDAMDGDATRFAREDAVEEAWRMFDPAPARPAPVQPCPVPHWGPGAAACLAPPGGWHNPHL